MTASPPLTTWLEGPREEPPVGARQAEGPSLPWRQADLYVLVSMTAVGLVILLAAAIGAHRTEDLSTQLLFVAEGAFGLIVAGAGGALWVSSALRSVRQRALAVPVAVQAMGRPSLTTSPEAIDAGGGFVTVPGGRHWHRADCMMVAGKATAPFHAATSGDHVPCAVCTPT